MKAGGEAPKGGQTIDEGQRKIARCRGAYFRKGWGKPELPILPLDENEYECIIFNN